MRVPAAKKTGMTRWQIRARLGERGITLAQISRDLDLDDSAASKACVVYWPGVTEAVARRLELPPHHVWPCWFYVDGTPRPPQHRSKSGSVGARAFGQVLQGVRENADLKRHSAESKAAMFRKNAAAA